jgi:S1/P1 Nuclease
MLNTMQPDRCRVFGAILARALCAALWILPCTAWRASAWGPEGHAIVADLAQAHLSPTAAAAVSELLKLEGHTKLDEISSWADAYRTTHPETGPWHFVDIPLAAPVYDEQRDCHYDSNDRRVPERTCIIAKLPEFVAILSDKSKPPPDRLQALKFVVHLVGDIHQPLHAENKGDRGGNDVAVNFFGTPTNLHAAWDGAAIERHYGWVLGPNFTFNHGAVAAAAAQIDQSESGANRLRWAPNGIVGRMNASAVSWANESHRLAPAAYRQLKGRNRPRWSAKYEAYAWPVIELQLKRAGARLAELLNESLQ